MNPFSHVKRKWRRWAWKCALLLILMLPISSCDGHEVLDDPHRIKYYQDDRTGMCFALLESSTHNGWRVRSIANVPCTSSVMALVGGKP